MKTPRTNSLLWGLENQDRNTTPGTAGLHLGADNIDTHAFKRGSSTTMSADVSCLSRETNIFLSKHNALSYLVVERRTNVAVRVVAGRGEFG